MSASDPTVAELLTAVNAAIYDLVTKKYKQTTVNNKVYTRQDLQALRQMRNDLKMEARSRTSSIRLVDISGT